MFLWIFTLSKLDLWQRCNQNALMESPWTDTTENAGKHTILLLYYSIMSYNKTISSLKWPFHCRWHYFHHAVVHDLMTLIHYHYLRIINFHLLLIIIISHTLHFLCDLMPLIHRRTFLQCFDTVGWVIWPVKTRPHMTYNVLVGR